MKIQVTKGILEQLAALPGTTDIGKLLRHQAGLTKREIRQAKFRPGGILKNGVRCRVTEPVKQGDMILVCLESEENRSDHLETFQGEEPRALAVLYEDEDLLVAEKPAGMASHPSGSHYRDTLANLVQSHLLGKGEACRIRPVGRLDRETSGIMVFAKNQAAAARLGEQRKKGEFQKIYTALARGELPAGSSGCICRPIGPDPGNRFRMRIDEKGKAAVTHWRAEASGGGYSLLKLWLETGRTHQIRVHMAWMGYPLAGDRLYGDHTENGMCRAALHAGRVRLIQPFTGKALEFEATLPRDMRELAENTLRGVLRLCGKVPETSGTIIFPENPS